MNRQEDSERSDRSKPTSRRNSVSLSRRSSLKERDKDSKKSPLNTAPNSANSTPKKTASVVSTPKKNVAGIRKSVKESVDFLVTGKQILKRNDRANSLPGSCHRRQSTDSIPNAKRTDSPKRLADVSQSSKSQETSLEEDMSLDLSQVSDFEDTNSKYGFKFAALATSTPKPVNVKPRSASLQNQLHSLKLERRLKSQDSSKQSREMSLSYSRDSFRTSSTGSPHRCTTELDYSSVSPEYSGQSSTDLSPTTASQVMSPRSQDLQLSSCCVSTWQECSEDRTKVESHRTDGEWTSFWANYNNSLATVPLKQYYDQCPTPYRTENFDLADFECSDGARKRSPDNFQAINNIICNEGLHLTPRETQNMIKCAHLLGNVLTKAIERRTKHIDTKEVISESMVDIDNPELVLKKQTMSLDLKETSLPVKVEEERKCESATQTDISLPNTKAAPRIFESILRQLSRSSIDVGKIVNKDEGSETIEKKDE